MAGGEAERLRPKLRTQAWALFKKNGAQQRRAWKSNLGIIATPFIFCVLLLILQKLVDKAFDTPDNKCGCYCLQCCSTNSTTGQEQCRDNSPANPCQAWEDCQSYDESRCGIQYSSGRQAGFCEVAAPSSWPAMLQVPALGFRAHPWSPNAALLYTGQDKAAADAMTQLMFPAPDPTPEQQDAAQAWALEGRRQSNQTVYASAVSLLGATIGTWQRGDFYSYLLEPGFVASDSDDYVYNASLYLVLPNEADNDPANLTGTLESLLMSSSAANAGGISLTGVNAQLLWNESVDDVNRQLFCGYKQARCDGNSNLNEITQAWDFQDTSTDGKYNLMMWYNATNRFGTTGNSPPVIVRVNQGLNKAFNAWVQWAISSRLNATLVGIMDFPRISRKLTVDFSSLLGPLFVCWLCQMLLPLMLVQLVHEKEKRLRTMMKMHGLGDAAYWLIMYLWFFALNFVFTWVLIGFGSAIDLSFFRRTQYSLQFVFYFLWNNNVVSFAFLLSTFFRASRTAVVVAFLLVFGTGLVGLLLLEQFISQNHWWLVFLELIPGFALYRGLYEIAQYAFQASYTNSEGMTWSKLADPDNGTITVMIIFLVEWIVFLLLAWYLEQVLNTGIGVPRHPLFFLGKRFGSGRGDARLEAAKRKSADGAVEVQVEAEDVRAERLRVENLLREGPPTPASVAASRSSKALAAAAAAGGAAASNGEASPSHLGVGGGEGGGVSKESVVVQDLWKIFPPMGGNKAKAVVRGLSLAVERGECFGLLGPNGAGKSTTINMLTGFLEPTGGTAWVEGNDIRNDMGVVYGLMGVCPQEDLLWETLTARDHLLFYGRLKNLKGRELDGAVEAALRSVNLWNGGVADKQVRAFSGGMKRRLSVAISFMGDPLVVYLDEPSTGLDPASRHNLWEVVKHAKADRGIMLTTHSMEEAAVLCDRLGIFVDGQLVCIGNPKQLTARYGGYYVFTITTPPSEEQAADALVKRMAPGAKLTYALAGTRKYELPADQVTLGGVFDAMASAAGQVTVLDWGVANATLEEVFIKFAKSIGAEGGN